MKEHSCKHRKDLWWNCPNNNLINNKQACNEHTHTLLIMHIKHRLSIGHSKGGFDVRRRRRRRRCWEMKNMKNIFICARNMHMHIMHISHSLTIAYIMIRCCAVWTSQKSCFLVNDFSKKIKKSCKNILKERDLSATT